MSKFNYLFNKPLRLLPNYFKKIGLGLILSTIIFLIATKLSAFHFVPEKKQIIKVLLRDIVVLGMFFIAFSKEKVEDELTMQIRLKALASAFVYFIFMQIGYDVTNFVFNEPLIKMQGEVFTMMTWYFFAYYALRYFR